MHLIVAAGSSNPYQGPVVLLIVQCTVRDRSSARDLTGCRTGAGTWPAWCSRQGQVYRYLGKQRDFGFSFCLLLSKYVVCCRWPSKTNRIKVGRWANLWVFIQEWVQSKLEEKNWLWKLFLQEASAKSLQMQANEWNPWHVFWHIVSLWKYSVCQVNKTC